MSDTNSNISAVDPSDPSGSYDFSPEELRRLGHKVIDLMADIMDAERGDPVLPENTGAATRARFDLPLPTQGRGFDETLRQCTQLLSGGLRRNGHPRFFGYVCASADPIGVFADAICSALNQNVTAWRSAPAATEMERLVLRWLAEMVGFGADGHGLLVSGGSAANAAGIGAALASAAERSGGADPVPRDRMTLYVSSEGHLSLAKAARCAGLRNDHVRTIGVDSARRMDVDELTAMLRRDVDAGLVPACVCASAGTANTGAIDPLDEIASVCEQFNVWFHIDGAYGAPAAMTEEYAWMSRAFARADSLSLDPHKWLFAPLDVGCIMFRDAEITRRAFALTTSYVAVHQTDEIESFAFFDHGVELSRRFRALKVWMILATRGTRAIANVIRRNIALRKSLDKRIAAEPQLESLGSQLGICCFRYVPTGWRDEDLINRINERLLDQIVAEGHIFMSPTTLEGRYSLRVCIVNFRTRESDIDFLINEVLRVGTALAAD